MRPVPALLAAILAACSADPSSGGIDDGPDAAVDDVDEGEVPLEVDTPPPTTYWASLPLSGRGPARGTLIYTTPAGGEFATDLGADGTFCVDIQLSKGTLNRIVFEAVSPSGDYSEQVAVEVRQDGEPPDVDPQPDPQPAYVNVARDSTGFDMSVSVEEGALSGLVDDDESGVVTLRNAATALDWIAIDLTERAPIDQFRIKTTDDCPMESYDVLLNDLDNDEPVRKRVLAVDPWTYGEGWTVVATVTNGTSNQTVYPSIGSPMARRVGIEFKSNDCAGWWEKGRHQITEIEVWAETETEQDQPTGDGSPSCSTGG